MKVHELMSENLQWNDKKKYLKSNSLLLIVIINKLHNMIFFTENFSKIQGVFFKKHSKSKTYFEDL